MCFKMFSKNKYLIAAREKFQILKNGSETRSLATPDIYNMSLTNWMNEKIDFNSIIIIIIKMIKNNQQYGQHSKWKRNLDR